MIPAIHPRGTRVGGLLRYLFGPGKREEHRNPRLVAAWNGAGDLDQLQPPTRTNGTRDVRRLTELLEQPIRSAWNAPATTVWHCSIRTHPTDRLLSDDQWAHIAGEVMAAVGLAPHGDTSAVRWVVVRHNDDHVHLVATLVRQDRRTAWAWKDKLHAQHACRDLEERYNLYRVGPSGTGTRRWPSPSEVNKAARLNQTDRRGRPQPARDQLRRHVRAAAATADGEVDFFARLAAAGVQIKLRYSTRDPGQITGYAVAMEHDTTAAGDPVWYSGGRLAPDLTLPQLRNRWPEPDPTVGPGSPARLVGLAFPAAAYERAANTVRRAAEAMRAAPDPANAAEIADAASDLLTSVAHAQDGTSGGLLTDAAELFDRATRELHTRRPATPNPHAHGLRSMARLLSLMGVIAHNRETAILVQLIHALAGLADSLAGLREAQQRLHQAEAARAAARQLRTYLPTTGESGSRPHSTNATHADGQAPSRHVRRGR